LLNAAFVKAIPEKDYEGAEHGAEENEHDP